jgi:ankyrin repeat protein
VNASNNAGDTAWHWAVNMGWGEVASLLERNGASKQKGQVLVPEHVPKVKVSTRHFLALNLHCLASTGWRVKRCTAGG